MLDISLYLMMLAVSLLLVAVIVAGIFFVVWLVHERLLNTPALLREAVRPHLHYQQRVSITGGFYASHSDTLKSREGIEYQIEIDGVGKEKIAIRHLRPLLPPALPAPKEPGEECTADYPALPSHDDTWLRTEFL